MKGSECRSNVVSHFSMSRHSCSCILNSLLQFCLQFLMVNNVIYFGDVSKVKKCYFTYLMRSLSNVIAKFLTWLLEFIGNESRYETTDDKYFFLFLYWAVETSDIHKLMLSNRVDGVEEILYWFSPPANPKTEPSKKGHFKIEHNAWRGKDPVQYSVLCCLSRLWTCLRHGLIDRSCKSPDQQCQGEYLGLSKHPRERKTFYSHHALKYLDVKSFTL